MSKLIIVEGNSNDKDNVRAYMVKGETGEASTIDVSKTDGVATITIKDNRGTQTVEISDGELTRENVIDDLTSTITDQPLSANQGKVLKNLIDDVEEKTVTKIFNIADKIDLKNIKDLVYSGEDLYMGNKHYWLQGLCVINEDKIVFGLCSPGNADNYIRLVEYSLTDNNVVREKYLELNHANSITYDKTNEKLYVAACNRVTVPGTVVNDNTIFVLSYNTLEIERSFIPANIPSGKRIRSVYYDNENKILYGGGSYEVFKLAEDYSVSEMIELEMSSIHKDTVIQTYKVYNDLIIGVFITYIGYWDLKGNLIKIVNITPNQGDINLGEIEDLDFISDSEFILGTAKGYAPSNKFDEKVVSFYKGDIYNNINNLLKFNFSNDATATLPIYVDNTSLIAQEDGSETKPFKNLQRAISIAAAYGKKVVLNIKGTFYDKIYIANNCSIDLSIQNDVTIDGIELCDSYLHIVHNAHCLTVNGMYVYNSKLIFKADSTNKSVINVNDDEQNVYYQKALQTLNSSLDVENVIFNLSDLNDTVYIAQESRASIRSCTFNDYENYHAISVVHNSIVNLYDNTYSESLSATQHNIKVMTGSLVNVTNGMLNKNNFTLYSDGKVFPSKGKIDLSSDVYYGEICDVDNHYNVAVLKVKVPSLNTSCKYMIIHLSDTGTNTVMDAMWMTPTSTYIGLIGVKQENGKLTITHNKLMTLTNGTQTNEELLTNTPDSKWLCVKDVTFYIL